MDLPPNHEIVIDFNLPVSKNRLFVYEVDPITNQKTVVLTTKVAHGKGSDTNNDGIVDKVSNTPNSLASSIGTYRIAEQYFGKHGKSYRLDGLDSTNSNARMRAIVIHEADYVDYGGKSWGCPAVQTGVLKTLKPFLHYGTKLIIIFNK